MDLRYGTVLLLLTTVLTLICTEFVSHDRQAVTNDISQTNTAWNTANGRAMTGWDASRRLHEELMTLNAFSARLGWQLAVQPRDDIARLYSRLGELRTSWRNAWCNSEHQGAALLLPRRQSYLLCRGPKYTIHQIRQLNAVLRRLQNLYSGARVCRHPGESCYRGEPDLERLMRDSRDPAELLWAWQSWRRAVGPPARQLYPALVALQNQGARNNGYSNIGDCWREELEMSHLEETVEELYRQVEPLYVLLHAVVRYRLNQLYGEATVPAKGPIPAHVLGNMWAQNWESLLDIVKPEGAPDFNLTAALRTYKYTPQRMVRHAEDFYISLGLEPMTRTFWTHSVFEKPMSVPASNATCHGTAVNMYQSEDYWMLLCAEVNAEDFYVIHHEMGHIQYFMAYKDQPTIFQDGANSAFQEAVGDLVMYGVMAPQHLQRLGFINDSLTAQGLDLVLLIRQALSKLPQLPFGLIMDKWRWDVFRGDISPEDYNKAWWRLRYKYQGIKSPVPRADDDFDPAAKFHITDNTPYIRYFLSGVLQIQMFKAMCEIAVLGKTGTGHALPMPLHRCDIYGSKLAGTRLRSMMHLGSSHTWQEALFQLTGTTKLDVTPLLQYFEPVYHWLLNEVERYNIPVGWD